MNDNWERIDTVMNRVLDKITSGQPIEERMPLKEVILYEDDCCEIFKLEPDYDAPEAA